jgi:hypothetical protein
MKLFLVPLAFLLAFMYGRAQQANVLKPDLKPGLIMEYEAISQGQTVPMILKISAVGEEGIVFEYDIMGSMTGKFVNSKTNLEKGKLLNWDQPVPGEERILADEQTIACLSRTFLKELKSEKKASYDGITLLLKEMPKELEILVGRKTVDAILAESESGAVKYWILNNDDFPILLKLEGNPAGIDLFIKDIR